MTTLPFMHQYRIDIGVMVDGVFTLTNQLVGDSPTKSLQIKMITTESSKGSGVSNKGTTLQIYNVNPDIKQALIQENGYVQVYAGWRFLNGENPNATLDLVYSGDVTHVSSNRPNVDVITEIQLSDGHKLKKTTGTAKASKGNTLEGLLRAVTKEFVGVTTVVNLAPNKSGIVSQKARNFSGNIAEILDNLTKEFELSWYVSKNTVYVVDNNKKALSLQVGLTTPISNDQVKGYIDFSKDNSTIKASESTKKEAKLTVRLNPQLKLGSRVLLDIPSDTGQISKVNFVIESVRHSLDMFGTSWDTTIECIEEI